MTYRAITVAAFALAAFIPAANALTIDNQDKSAYTLKVTPKGGKEVDLAVKANATATVDCGKGCKIMLGSASQEVDGKAAKLTIKGGKLAL